MKKSTLEQALYDPASVFSRPDAVVEDDSLSLDLKVEILHRWAYDAIELAVAEEEGMAGGETTPVSAVMDALHRLTCGPELFGHTSPTKHSTS